MNKEVTLSAIEELLDRKMDQKLSGIHTRMDSMETKMDSLETKVDSLEVRAGSLENNASIMRDKLGEVDIRLRRVELTLENDISPSIMRVAEGHLDLNRKLNEAIKTDHEKEMLSVKINYLYAEMQKWNERYQHVAQ